MDIKRSFASSFHFYYNTQSDCLFTTRRHLKAQFNSMKKRKKAFLHCQQKERRNERFITKKFTWFEWGEKVSFLLLFVACHKNYENSFSSPFTKLINYLLYEREREFHVITINISIRMNKQARKLFLVKWKKKRSKKVSWKKKK